MWPVTVVVPVVVALDYLGSASQGVKNVERVAWREQLWLIPFMVVGVLVGLWALREMGTTLLARLLGGFVVLYAIYQMLPLPDLRGSGESTAGPRVHTIFARRVMVIRLCLSGVCKPASPVSRGEGCVTGS